MELTSSQLHINTSRGFLFPTINIRKQWPPAIPLFTKKFLCSGLNFLNFTGASGSAGHRGRNFNSIHPLISSKPKETSGTPIVNLSSCLVASTWCCLKRGESFFFHRYDSVTLLFPFLSNRSSFSVAIEFVMQSLFQFLCGFIHHVSTTACGGGLPCPIGCLRLYCHHWHHPVSYYFYAELIR